MPDRHTGREFMFNPTNISHSHSASYGTSLVAGASHPQYQYGAGGEEVLAFDLFLDGDRARAARGIPQNAYGNNPLDVADEIDFYESLLLPSRYGGTNITSVFPGIVLFTYGTQWDAVPCIVPSVTTKVEFWVPDPARGNRVMPVRATVSLQLKVVVHRSMVAAERWPDGMGGG